MCSINMNAFLKNWVIFLTIGGQLLRNNKVYNIFFLNWRQKHVFKVCPLNLYFLCALSLCLCIKLILTLQKEEIAKQFMLPERKSKIATLLKQDGQAYCICRSSDSSRFMM